MKILVIGSGGREHALAWRCAHEGHEIHVAPGSDGITADAALAYERRVCEGSGVAPPAPQDWYASHPGSSNEVDDFAAAVADPT